jgi:hypothetical protein
VSSGTKLLASEWNVTKRPSALIEGAKLTVPIHRGDDFGGWFTAGECSGFVFFTAT